MPPFSFSRRAVAAAATLLTAAGVATVAASSDAGAATSTIVTISALSPNRLPALTANQVLTITGTGFDESVISSVAVNGCTAGSYIVQTPTTLLFKTDGTCATTSTGVVTITDTSSNTAVSNPAATGGKQVLAFVAAPSIVSPTASVRPVVTDNTVGMAYANQVTSALTTGGTAVRVTAGSVPFVDTSTYKLSASLDGVAMTSVVVHTGGDYFTAVAGAHVADAAPVLKITSNGVSKSFVYGTGGATGVAGTHDFAYAGSSLKVSPAFGPTKGGNTLSITGSGFTTSTTVTVGGTSCPVNSTGRTATLMTCTAPATTAAAAGAVVATTGGVATVVGAGSTYTYVSQ